MIIQIHDWKLNVLIGVHPYERTQKQLVVADVDIKYDGKKASETDRLEDALDYEDLQVRIEKSVSKTGFSLLEKLAVRICDEVLRDNRVSEVKITLFKPAALKKIARVSLVYEQKR